MFVLYMLQPAGNECCSEIYLFQHFDFSPFLLFSFRYVMIAHHGSYAKIYKKHWIAAMILFCWLFSYGMQLPTLFKVWGMCAYGIQFNQWEYFF